MEEVHREAAVLVCKGKVGVLDEAIHQADEFAHDGDEANLGGFAVGAQALVEGGEDGVGAGGADGGHVEDVAHLRAAAADVSGEAGGAGVFGMGATPIRAESWADAILPSSGT